ncbi:hypothetical protein MCOR25_008206 [Pyricularia grisea]|nr:hypothetical protein MCOR25_008206 [Pyricularia grisea]
MQLHQVLANLSVFATSVLAAPSLATLVQPGLKKAKIYSGNSANQLIDGTPCRAISVVYARGTTQAGNIGNSISVGPITFDALVEMVGQHKVAVQGVDYKASFHGYAEGGQPDATGKTVNLITHTLQRCPKTKLFLLGYSQGAQVVHNVVEALPAPTAMQLTGILTFGDPDAKDSVPEYTQGKWNIICHSDDRLCKGSHLHVTYGHLNYQKDAKRAAKWIATKAGALSQAPNAVASRIDVNGLGSYIKNMVGMAKDHSVAGTGGIAAPAARRL